MAHGAGAALRHGIEPERLEAVCTCRANCLFSAAERAGPAPAMAASAQPNEVDDALFARMTQAWTEWRMVEIVSVTSLFGFFSRFNATLATPRENPPGRTAAAHLFAHRREAGKHAR